MKNYIIAIDGTSSTGKSTIAKALATHFGFLHIDSGAMYRAITLFAIQKNIYHTDLLNKEKLIEQLPFISILFKKNGSGNYEIYLNNENVEKKIRGVEVTKKVSFIAAIPQVRNYLINLQRNFMKDTSIVMDGRDIGTTVFPNADVKLFITSPIEIRAKRRYKELINSNVSITLEEVQTDLMKRDQMDINRDNSPLKKATDAIEIDNSNLSIEEIIQKAIFIIERIVKK